MERGLEGEDAAQGAGHLAQGSTLVLHEHHPHPLLLLLNTVFCSLEGGRRSQWVRNWAVWRYFRDYFPIQVKTCGCYLGRVGMDGKSEVKP